MSEADLAAGPYRPVRRLLGPGVTPAHAARVFRGDERPVALTGRWAGGATIVASEPVAVVEPGDPFAPFKSVPAVDDPGDCLIGGGWFGYLGYQLGRRVEALPEPPPRPVPLPASSFGFYDNVLVFEEATREWWFEALWTPARAAALEDRFRLLRARLGRAPTRDPYVCGDFVALPNKSVHCEAVKRALDYIAAGDIFQVNLCLRLEASFCGDPVDLFCDAIARLAPSYGGFVGTPHGSIASMSPELFLRRTGGAVLAAPIKGTCKRSGIEPHAAHDLLTSEKNNAENIMIVDLMRNDLGRVCKPGTVRVPSIAHAEPHPGVWHLVSHVTGELLDDVGDDALLRAAFPSGSITGAPKVRAMEIISELETSAREVYTGSVGYVSPVAGLEFNVAIRTFELAAGRAWLGVGGGIVVDSDPGAEWEECRVKAEPLLAAVGSRWSDESQSDRPAGVASRQ